MKTTTTPVDLAAVVDKLASVNAQINRLEEQAGELKSQLIASRMHEVKGTKHKAVIFGGGPTTITNWRGIVERLGASTQMIRAYTRPSTQTMRVSLYDL